MLDNFGTYGLMVLFRPIHNVRQRPEHALTIWCYFLHHIGVGSCEGNIIATYTDAIGFLMGNPQCVACILLPPSAP